MLVGIHAIEIAGDVRTGGIVVERNPWSDHGTNSQQAVTH